MLWVCLQFTGFLRLSPASPVILGNQYTWMYHWRALLLRCVVMDCYFKQLGLENLEQMLVLLIFLSWLNSSLTVALQEWGANWKIQFINSQSLISKDLWNKDNHHWRGIIAFTYSLILFHHPFFFTSQPPVCKIIQNNAEESQQKGASILQ